MARLTPQPLHDLSLKAFSEGKNVWFLPNKQAVIVDKDCESLQQAMETAKRGADELHAPEVKSEPAAEVQFSKLKKMLFWIVSVFVLVLCVIFAIESRYFDHVYTSDNKVVDMASLYEVMELPYGASKSVIKKEYRKLAVKYHPDRNQNCTDCARIFDSIAAAYKILVPGDAHIPTGFDDGVDQIVRLRNRKCIILIIEEHFAPVQCFAMFKMCFSYRQPLAQGTYDSVLRPDGFVDVDYGSAIGVKEVAINYKK